MIIKCLSIFIGGGLGSILRYLVTLLAKKTLMYPLIGTFFVNISLNNYFISLKPTVLIIIKAINKIFKNETFSWKVNIPIKVINTIPTAPQTA